jgi:hypothetical protein
MSSETGQIAASGKAIMRTRLLGRGLLLVSLVIGVIGLAPAVADAAPATHASGTCYELIVRPISPNPILTVCLPF